MKRKTKRNRRSKTEPMMQIEMGTRREISLCGGSGGGGGGGKIWKQGIKCVKSLTYGSDIFL